MEQLLEVQDLSTHFFTSDGVVRAVDGITFDVKPGETVAVVGESGSGKSVSALSIMRLIMWPPGRIISGRVIFAGRDLLALSDDEIRHVRGRDIGMVFQEPMTSLNPVLTIGRQLTETLEHHLAMTPAQARTRAIELLGLVGIAEPHRRLRQYPHHFSGGMRQRVMIAMALACEPKLIIADEPTTALDVTIQAQILELMKDLTRRLGAALIIITHNLGVVARYADRVNVMYAGRIVESGTARDIYYRPRHPYTHGAAALRAAHGSAPHGSRSIRLRASHLISPGFAQAARFVRAAAIAVARCAQEAPSLEVAAEGQLSACWERARLAPRMPGVDGMSSNDATPGMPRGQTALAQPRSLLSVRGLKMHFAVTEGALITRTVGHVKAVDGVSFDIRRGETLGLVGESGCGKTTLGRCILQLERPTAGDIVYDGQSPQGPRARCAQSLASADTGHLPGPLQLPQPAHEDRRHHRRAHLRARLAAGSGKAAGARARAAVGLSASILSSPSRYPHEMSGGQRQRVGIARALAMKPEFIVCDEAISALDVSIQAQVINLLEDLRDKFQLTYLFIAHDLSVVRHICASRRRHVSRPRRGTRRLRRAVRQPVASLHAGASARPFRLPIPTSSTRARTRSLEGEVPSPMRPPSGCVFHPRCSMAVDGCSRSVPELREVRPGHFVACTEVDRQFA